MGGGGWSSAKKRLSALRHHLSNGLVLWTRVGGHKVEVKVWEAMGEVCRVTRQGRNRRVQM